MARLDPMPASAEPRALRVSSALSPQPATLNDVLVGEVWLGSGQSNMAMTVNRCNHYEQEQAAAKLPLVRMFREASLAADEPQTVGSGTWTVCAPDTVGGFSATLYFYGRELHRELGVPVGLINSSVGGTPIEAWISLDAQLATPELKDHADAQWKSHRVFKPETAKAAYEKNLARWKEAAKKARAAGKTPPRAPRDPVATRKLKGGPGGLFNAKIAPLVPFAIRGAVWYQGESNAGGPPQSPLYRHQLPLLIKDWRARWGQGDFPFAWVQLPNYGTHRDFPAIREAMLQSLAVPNTGMAITIDIGDPKDIHPKNKQDVGRRLSLWALGTVYGRKVATSGPLPVSHKINGGEIAITFKHTDGGLVVKIGEALVTPRGDSPTVWPEGLGGFGQVRGFAVAGADRKWHAAKAKIVGDTVIVAAPEVKQPVAVRYAWASNPDCNLYNRAGLPASPFRTDDWTDAAPPSAK
jgi:sialate O-acetylesterase